MSHYDHRSSARADHHDPLADHRALKTRPTQVRRRSQSLPGAQSVRSHEHESPRSRKMSSVGLRPVDSISNSSSLSRGSSSTSRSPTSAVGYGARSPLEGSSRMNHMSVASTHRAPSSVGYSPSPLSASTSALHNRTHHPHPYNTTFPATAAPAGPVSPASQVSYAPMATPSNGPTYPAAADGQTVMPYHNLVVNGQAYSFAYPMQTTPRRYIQAVTTEGVPLYVDPNGGQVYTLSPVRQERQHQQQYAAVPVPGMLAPTHVVAPKPTPGAAPTPTQFAAPTPTQVAPPTSTQVAAHPPAPARTMNPREKKAMMAREEQRYNHGRSRQTQRRVFIEDDFPPEPTRRRSHSDSGYSSLSSGSGRLRRDSPSPPPPAYHELSGAAREKKGPGLWSKMRRLIVGNPDDERPRRTEGEPSERRTVQWADAGTGAGVGRSRSMARPVYTFSNPKPPRNRSR